MLVDVRTAARLRGEQPIDLPGALASIIEAVLDGPLDLSRLRIVCDWIQYRHNFREPVTLRAIVPAPGRGRTNGAVNVEIAVDLRRSGSAALVEPVCSRCSIESLTAASCCSSNAALSIRRRRRRRPRLPPADRPVSLNGRSPSSACQRRW